MKKILGFIFLFIAIAFTACADQSGTQAPSSANETKATQEVTESISTEKPSTPEPEAELSDEEYLIHLGEQLKLGMTEQEVYDEIGIPDDYVGSGILSLFAYYKGQCKLYVDMSRYYVSDVRVYYVSDIRVYNEETGNTICISSYDEETSAME